MTIGYGWGVPNGMVLFDAIPMGRASAMALNRKGPLAAGVKEPSPVPLATDDRSREATHMIQELPDCTAATSHGGADEQGSTAVGRDLCDFFGGAWDYAPNGTFSDMPSDVLGQAADDLLAKALPEEAAAQQASLLLSSGPGAPPIGSLHNHGSLHLGEHAAAARFRGEHVAQMGGGGGGQASGASPTKAKQPNLYESLRRSSMMMTMNPYGAMIPDYGGGAGGVPMSWSPQLLAAALAGSNGHQYLDTPSAALYPQTMSAASPTMVPMDFATQHHHHYMTNQMKRARVSPYMSPIGGGLTQAPPPLSMDGPFFSNNVAAAMFSPYAAAAASMMGRMARPAKVPLSPVAKASGAGESQQTTPLVLPMQDSRHSTSQPARTMHQPAARIAPLPSRGDGRGAPFAMPATDQGCPADRQGEAERAALGRRTEEDEPASLEANIEHNLRLFLKDTNNLVWESITVVELKRILRNYELNTTGKKGDLMQRIAKIRHSYRHLQGAPASGSRGSNEEALPGSDGAASTTGLALADFTKVPFKDAASLLPLGRPQGPSPAAATVISSPETMGSDDGKNCIDPPGHDLDSLFSSSIQQLQTPYGEDAGAKGAHPSASALAGALGMETLTFGGGGSLRAAKP